MSTSATDVASMPLDTVLGASDVVFFDMEGCPFCDKAEAALSASGIVFTKVPIEDYRSELQERTSKTSAPSVWIKGRYVGGCNDGPQPWQGVLPLLENGGFQRMLLAPSPAEMTEEEITGKAAAAAPAQAPPAAAASAGQATGEEAVVIANDNLQNLLYEDAKKLSVNELKSAIAGRGGRWADLVEKDDFVERLVDLEMEARKFSLSGKLKPGKAVELDAMDLVTEIGDPRTPLFIDIFATWCGPCQMIAPYIEQIATKAGDRLRVAKLDADGDDAGQLLQELQVQGFPTIIMLKEGRAVLSFAGAPQTAEELEKLVTEYTGVQL